MSKKTKLKEIHNKLKQWANVVDDAEYDDLLNEFDGEINALDEEDNEGDPGGNNPPNKPKVP